MGAMYAVFYRKINISYSPESRVNPNLPGKHRIRIALERIGLSEHKEFDMLLDGILNLGKHFKI